MENGEKQPFGAVFVCLQESILCNRILERMASEVLMSGLTEYMKRSIIYGSVLLMPLGALLEFAT